MAYFYRKCQVLMWKNLIVRKRHYILTLIEFVIPVLLFWLVAWARQSAIIGQKGHEIPAQVYPVFPNKMIYDYSFVHQDHVYLAYTPDVPFTKKIISEFNKTLIEVLKKATPSKLESFPAFDSELKMEEYFHKNFENKSSETNYIGFGIVFENVDNETTLPQDFKYKLRSTVPIWNTKSLFPQLLPTGPRQEASYFDRGFISIQLAIDNAYLQVAGASPEYDRSIQQFPYPSYMDDSFSMFFKSLMPVFTMLSFITICVSVLKKVVEEKASGVNELMKMMGLETWMVWAGWVLNGMMVYGVTCAVITFLLCYGFSPDKGPVIAHVHFTIVYALFLLFCVASIFFCFAISTFFTKPTIAMSVGMTVWLLSFSLLLKYLGRTDIPMPIFFLFSLVPIFNICSGYVIIAAFESREVTVTWLDLFSDATGGGDMSLGLVFCMFFIQMFVYMIITWYVTAIHPGPYGRAQPWHFIFKFFSSSKIKKNKILENFDDGEDERYEAPPTDLKVGLKIQDLRKVFGNVVAVDKVNLEIYEGQITALLGHNGAGKTTTMSIITGMYSPSSGTIYAKDYNIFEDMDRFRNSLGLCPQHDLLFPYLTALEHLIFFGMLKGMNKILAQSEGMKLLHMLRIHEKKNVLADKLSGGMKRKLSLAIALMGSPQVLILDEPTSGMDPESRREMWDLLLKLRGARTILITTHFMEEADVLGDRIAIMDHGRVKCYGTTLFLKRIYGTGYQLTVMKKPQSRVDYITDTIKLGVAGAELKSMHSSQVVYRIPQEQALNLAPMFRAIEDRKEELGIEGVGISCTTMEEVFLKVGQLAKEEKDYDKSSSHSKDHTSNTLRNRSNEALTYRKKKGLPLIIQQFKSLIHKRSLFSIRRPIASLIFFALPLFLMWMTIQSGGTSMSSSEIDPPLTFQLKDYGHTTAYVSGPQQDQQAFKTVIEGQDSSVESVNNSMVEALMEIGEENIARYKTKVIVAADFNTSSNSATSLYSGIAYHSAPISVNVLSNSLLRKNPKTSENTITTINHPLDLKNFEGACNRLNDSNRLLTALIWLILVPIGIKGYLMDLITFPHIERTSNAKQLQLMTGVPPLLYWVACFVWDYLMYFIACLAMIVIIIATDNSAMFTTPQDYGVLFLILALFGLSGIVSTYLYSFWGKSSNTSGSIFTLVTLITGVILPFVMYFMIMLDSALEDAGVQKSAYIKPLNFLFCLDPPYAFGSAILNYASLLSIRSACLQCNKKYLKDTTCGGIEEKSYLEFSSKTNRDGILQYIIFLALDWILYLAIILLIEYGYMRKLTHLLKVLWVGKDFDELLREEDSDVRDERDRVDAARDASKDDSTVLTVDSLAKKFSRSFAAVQGVSFQVSAGECFGLLGVNGAGKTTTFRMLTGDENPTAGSARILHYDLVHNRTKYLSQIGYCPQFDGINGFLTGEEVLRLFANLRGMPKEQMRNQIDDWISLLGLDEYRHRRCGKYSGGNKRKLSTAMALIGDPPVVFLDEPTTGVDPMARRNLWDTLARCQKAGQAIVLTSHSMEECEALCTRLTIMVRGRMKCIGSNQYLKQRYGQGYTIMVKLNQIPDKEVALDHLKTAIQRKFTNNCVLKDEHQSLLHYQMSDTTLPLSQLFSNMQDLKKAHNVIEDYTVSDTTLEQVFIAFARQAGEEEEG